MAGFEPATSRVQVGNSSQAELHSELEEGKGFEPLVLLGTAL